MFNVNSIASYIQQPDIINIELTEAIWSELGWTTKSDAVRKLKSELIDGTDYRVSKVAQGGESFRNDYYLSYNGLKILAASTTTAKGKAYRRHLVVVENKYIQLMKSKPMRSLSFDENIEIAYEALGVIMQQRRNTKNKPGLRNIFDHYSKPNTLDASPLTVEQIVNEVFNVELTSGELNSLGRTCATTYRTWHNAEPKKEPTEVNGRKVLACLYGTEMYSTIENWLINKGYSVAS